MIHTTAPHVMSTHEFSVILVAAVAAVALVVYVSLREPPR